MKFFKKIKSLLGLRDFTPDPRMEEFVSRIDELIVSLYVIKYSEWSQAGYSPDAKSKMTDILRQIDGVVQEGGEELRKYLLPWKGLKEYPFEDHKRVRAANQLH